jgi:4-hydroxybenzoate polyprenyltransferase
MKESFKAYFDLLRLHFFFVWPLLFCSGLFLAFQQYNGFSWLLVVKAVFIGFLGFEAGFILNDYVDREVDTHDIEFDKMTPYWRLFKTKPLAQHLIPPQHAVKLFVVFVVLALGLIFTLPFPHSLYVTTIIVYSYVMEYFYQVKKRNQTFPISQLLGRTDFTLFPIAGYLCIGHPDVNTLLFGLFFYPLAIAHLGVNDLIDIANDRIKQLKTIPILFSLRGTTYWIAFFTVIHVITALLFLPVLGTVSRFGFSIGIFLLSIANYMLLKGQNAQSGIRALPLFHITMLVYALSIIFDFWL